MYVGSPGVVLERKRKRECKGSRAEVANLAVQPGVVVEDTGSCYDVSVAVQSEVVVAVM